MPVRLPLTYQQTWLLRLLQIQPDWRCMVVYTHRIRGALSLPVLEKSLTAVLQRHESLRARLVSVGEEMALEVDEPSPFCLECTPIREDSTTGIEAAARRWLEGFSNRPVDYRIGPWFAVRLLELAADEHWLVLAVHRLIADCFSIEQVLSEVWSIYRSLARGSSVPFVTEAPQYGDYAIWQRQTGSERLERHWAHCQAHLAGAQPVRWPRDPHATSRPGAVIGRMNSWFGESLSASLRDFAQRSRTLSANVMLAIYVAVLSRWSQQNDFVVPFFVAGRQSEHRTVVGYFSHIVYLRMKLSGSESFNDLLRQVSNELFRALSHPDFGRMSSQELGLLTGTFFQWISWHPEGVGTLSIPTIPEPLELAVDAVTLEDFGEDLTALPPGMVAVEVTFFDTAAGIYASGLYRADHFTPATIDRFMTELRLAAKELIDDPDARVAAIILEAGVA